MPRVWRVSAPTPSASDRDLIVDFRAYEKKKKKKKRRSNEGETKYLWCYVACLGSTESLFREEGGREGRGEGRVEGVIH